MTEKTEELIAEARRHVPYAGSLDDNWCIHCADEWPCVTRRLADALEAVTRERDAALARIAELEAEKVETLTFIRHDAKVNARWRRLASETIREYGARIAEAAKLHHKDYTALGHPICNTCGTPYPCPTRRRLGLNEGENDD